MFVYCGKLNWLNYGKDETFAIVLPNGPVRVGDSVYLFSQWTRDSQGIQKANWFNTIVIDKVNNNPNGDDSFTLKGAWYTFEIATQKAYSSLNLVMSNPSKTKSDPMILQRVWKPQDDKAASSARIWTGKINWLNFAANELAMFIVPEGFGEGKPILSLWQWSQGSNGKRNDLQFREGTQKVETGTSDDIVKFSFTSYYEIFCKWDRKTEKLAVHMKEHGKGQDIGELSLSALIDRHVHNLNPPEAPPKRMEFEARLPQAQPTLPRVLTPLPFPRSLFETLTHTAAFIDQAGYLTKYANDRFAALDADFHAVKQQLDATTKEKANLLDQIKNLTNSIQVNNAKIETLEKALKDAAAREAKLQRELQDLITSTRDHDKKDHDAIKDLTDRLDTAVAENGGLRNDLTNLRSDLASLEKRLKQLQDEKNKAEDDLRDLRIKYESQVKVNDGLRKENATISAQKDALQKDLEKTAKDLESSLEDAQDARNDVEDLKADIKELRQARDKAFTEAKNSEESANQSRRIANEARDERKNYEDKYDASQNRVQKLEDILIKNRIDFPKQTRRN